MFETTSEPYKAWQAYGKMVNAAAPRGLVVISAHWEEEGGSAGVKGTSFSTVGSARLKLIGNQSMSTRAIPWFTTSTASQSISSECVPCTQS